MKTPDVSREPMTSNLPLSSTASFLFLRLGDSTTSFLCLRRGLGGDRLLSPRDLSYERPSKDSSNQCHSKMAVS